MGIVTGTARFNRRPDGIMVVEDEVLAKSPQHPIEALIKVSPLSRAHIGARTQVEPS